MNKKSWAVERNFTKMRLGGLIENIKQMTKLASTTRAEAAWLNDAIASLKSVKNNWKANEVASKRKYREENGGA